MTRPAIVVSWEYCKHDNHRLMPGKVARGEGFSRLITAPDYRQAKLGAEYQIKHQWRGDKLCGALELTARCFFPDNRKRDVGNYRKLLADAMSGIVYDDDAQLHREVWEKAGIDRENPRIEISINPL